MLSHPELRNSRRLKLHYSHDVFTARRERLEEGEPLDFCPRLYTHTHTRSPPGASLTPVIAYGFGVAVDENGDYGFHPRMP